MTILEKKKTIHRETSGSYSVSSSLSSFTANKCYCECNHELDHSKANYIALMLGGRVPDSYNFESTPMRAFLIGRSKFGGIVASLSVEKFRPLHHSPYTKARIQRCLLRPLKKVIMRFNAKGMYHFEPHFHHQIGHFIRLYYHPLCLEGHFRN